MEFQEELPCFNMFKYSFVISFITILDFTTDDHSLLSCCGKCLPSERPGKMSLGLFWQAGIPHRTCVIFMLEVLKHRYFCINLENKVILAQLHPLPAGRTRSKTILWSVSEGDLGRRGGEIHWGQGHCCCLSS